ncbi:MAG: universal stress protein [Solirubrobacteraceae bacterium]
MTNVLAAVAPDACARGVLSTAIALAGLLDSTPAGLHVRENGAGTLSQLARAEGVEMREVGGSASEQIMAAALEPDVAALVLGMRGELRGSQPVGRTALEIITRVAKPVVLVPPQAEPRERLTRILVPLEGTGETMQALEHLLELAGNRQLEILVLHLLSPDTLPAFADHEPHETEAWEREFLRGYVSTPDDRVRLVRRLGVPTDDIVMVANETSAELVALTWSQTLSPGHARVVSETLAHSDIPVLLLPRQLSRTGTSG